MQSAERVSHRDPSDNYVYQRSILAYHKASEMVSGRVLEIGTGSGYGIDTIAPKTEKFITIDKFDAEIDIHKHPDVEFKKMTVPPLNGIEDNSMDYVITFQVIEHIKNDKQMIAEIYRVLRPGGKLIISTPNKTMSLTRNPWHVREYTITEFFNLLSSRFARVDKYGVFGNDKVMEYYHKNAASVRSITRFDLLRVQYWLPSCILKIPYNILNRMNRRKLLTKNATLTSTIEMSDYRVAEAGEGCFDLFFVAEKV